MHICVDHFANESREEYKIDNKVLPFITFEAFSSCHLILRVNTLKNEEKTFDELIVSFLAIKISCVYFIQV